MNQNNERSVKSRIVSVFVNILLSLVISAIVFITLKLI